MDEIKKFISGFFLKVAPIIPEKMTPPIISDVKKPQYGREIPTDTDSCSESDSDSSDSGGDKPEKVCKPGEVSSTTPIPAVTGGGGSSGSDSGNIDPKLRWANTMIGDYPAEYNAKVHGPYDPARYYGKPDTPFGQVKLGELASWFSRRDKHPRAAIAAVSRAYWRWQHKYVLPRRSTIAPFLQFATASMVVFYALNHFKIKNHKNYKYH